MLLRVQLCRELSKMNIKNTILLGFLITSFPTTALSALTPLQVKGFYKHNSVQNVRGPFTFGFNAGEIESYAPKFSAVDITEEEILGPNDPRQPPGSHRIHSIIIQKWSLKFHPDHAPIELGNVKLHKLVWKGGSPGEPKKKYLFEDLACRQFIYRQDSAYVVCGDENSSPGPSEITIHRFLVQNQSIARTVIPNAVGSTVYPESVLLHENDAISFFYENYIGQRRSGGIPEIEAYGNNGHAILASDLTVKTKSFAGGPYFRNKKIDLVNGEITFTALRADASDSLPSNPGREDLKYGDQIYHYGIRSQTVFFSSEPVGEIIEMHRLDDSFLAVSGEKDWRSDRTKMAFIRIDRESGEARYRSPFNYDEFEGIVSLSSKSENPLLLVQNNLPGSGIYSETLALSAFNWTWGDKVFSSRHTFSCPLITVEHASETKTKIYLQVYLDTPFDESLENSCANSFGKNPSLVAVDKASGKITEQP